MQRLKEGAHYQPRQTVSTKGKNGEETERIGE
jgi:hypothetical protein